MVTNLCKILFFTFTSLWPEISSVAGVHNQLETGKVARALQRRLYGQQD